MKTSRSLSWSELKVGITVITGLVILALGILQLGGAAGFFTSNYALYLKLENAFGLKVGSTVRLAGLDIGNVEDISLPKELGDKTIMVRLNIQKKYEDRIRSDSTANIKTMGLLGDKYVEIGMGSPSAAILKDGDLLVGGPETQLTSVLAGASSGLEGLNVVLSQLKNILGNVSEGEGAVGLLLKDKKLSRDLAESVASLNRVSVALSQGKGTAGKLVVDPALYNNLVDVSTKAQTLMDKLNNGSIARLSDDKALYENLRDVTANLKDVSESSKSLMANLNSGNIAKLSKDKELYAKLDRISTRLDSAMERLDSGKGSAGKLLTDEKLYNNMDKFFQDADALVLDIHEHPDKYVKISVF